MQRIERWFQKRRSMLITLLLIASILLAAQILTPKTSTIYFDGVGDVAAFTLHPNEETVYSIVSDSYGNGKVQLLADKTDVIYAVSTTAPAEVLQEVLSGKHEPYYWLSGRDVFPFVDGCGTISGEFGMELVLRPAPGNGEDVDSTWEGLTYDIELTRGKESGIYEQNQIKLKNFSADMGIYLHGSHDLNMLGTAVQIPTGNYRIIGCKSIIFTLSPLASGTQDPSITLATSLDHVPLEHFCFTNSEKNTLEITYFAETKFSELGHTEVEGSATGGQGLYLDVESLCRYPYPVKVYGRVGRLDVAGATCYPSWAQWLLDNRSQLLYSIALLFIGMVIPKERGKKQANS